MLKDNKIEFDFFDEELYEKTFYDEKSKGFVVTEAARLQTANLNKQEKQKSDKEKDMCIVFAKAGHKIVRLGEKPRVPSPDVIFDNQKADLKRTGSANNIVKYAVHAIREQGAEQILFQFDTMNRKIFNELKRLRKMGIHGYYFITNYESDIYPF